MHPDRTYAISELISFAGVGSGTVQRVLDRFVSAELVRAIVDGRRKRYSANRHSPVFPELHGLLVKTAGVADPIRKALSPLLPRVERALIYGSIAKGTEHAGSDVDVMVVADDVQLEDLFEVLAGAEPKIGRKIHPTLYTTAEYEQRKSERNPFLTKVLSDEHIILFERHDGTPPTR